MDRKTCYVLDTSVLLHAPNSITSFPGNDVIIPYVVLEELDKFKTRDGEIGRNSRHVARQLNEFRSSGDLRSGVVVGLDSTLRIELNFTNPQSKHLQLKQNDDRILNVCLGLQTEGHRVTLVTRDINLAVRADVFGVDAEDFSVDKAVNDLTEMYSGIAELEVDESVINLIYVPNSTVAVPEGANLLANQYLHLVDAETHTKVAKARVSCDGTRLRLIPNNKTQLVWGVTPRNTEQAFAINALLDPDISLVTLTGKAGSGKTLISIAAALEMVQEKGLYDKVLISRPLQPMGKDVGYLPGILSEKMYPWMSPLRDTLDFLMKEDVDAYAYLLDTGVIEIEPLTYLRGRSLPRTLFIVDEAQDLSRGEIKTIISRMGENSKLILIGDVMQISNPYLDPTISGLSAAVQAFKSYGVAAHVTLLRGERSKLATIAAEIL